MKKLSMLKVKPTVVAVSIVMMAGCASIPGLSTLMQAPSVTGSWLVSRDDAVLNMTLLENDNKVTGTLGLSIFMFPVAGKRDGNKLDLTVTSTFGNATSSSHLLGDISSDGKRITGTIGGEASSSQFVAVKQ